MKSKFNIPVWIVIICFLALIIKPVLSQEYYSYEKVDNIARGTTVLIGKNLEPEQVENAEEDELSGSGVIIHRDCNTKPAMGASDLEDTTTFCEYYVLTNAHVIPTEKADYGIRTADGKVYGEGTSPTISGKKYDYNRQIHRYEDKGYDLAILSFISDIQYPIAAFGNPDNIPTNKPDNILYVSGWAQPPQDSQKDIKRYRQTLTGELQKRMSLGELSGNYTLAYTVGSKTGISGGPVFNRQGELIGIHGKGSGKGIGKGRTYAIDIKQFIDLVSSIDIDKKLNFAVSLPQSLDPLAITFGKSHKNSGDNMTEEERTKFVISDILRDDPRRESVEYLADKYGCLAFYEGGAIGAGLTNVRGQFSIDLNACMNMYETLVQENVAVQREKLDKLIKQIQGLEQKLSGLNK